MTRAHELEGNGDGKLSVCHWGGDAACQREREGSA